MPVRIYETDTWNEMAVKIFYEFEIDQSCTIEGFIMDIDKAGLPDPIPKGELVLTELESLDSKVNKSDGARRRRKYMNNTIGGYVVKKVFRFNKRITDKFYKVDIWRIQ